jgi:hypothetical protein
MEFVVQYKSAVDFARRWKLECRQQYKTVLELI